MPLPYPITGLKGTVSYTKKETSKALKRQNHTCGHCGMKCTSDERVHLHHRDGNHSNWKPKNLVAIHESCHDYIHMSNGAIP
jgi:RNA-directed DNA polymerase